MALNDGGAILIKTSEVDDLSTNTGTSTIQEVIIKDSTFTSCASYNKGGGIYADN